MRNTSAVYRIWGIAVERYRCQKCIVCISFVVEAILLNLASQSWPFASAAALWAFQLSLLSMMTPKNLAVSFDSIRWLPSLRACRRIGILFLWRKGCGLVLLVKSSNWNFSMLNSQLWSEAQSSIPPVLVMTFLSELWVSLKFFLVTMIAALLTKRTSRSPSLMSVMEGKSEL